MKIILGHENLDFDCLASMVGAKEIYTDFKIYLPNKISKEVKKFISFYKYDFKLNNSSNIDFKKERVKELVLVDTYSINRIGNYKNIIDEDTIITVYDHHKIVNDVIKNNKFISKNYGACASIIVEELIERQINISSIKSTLLLLGIYADTNRLSYSSTKYQDANAVAYLLKNNANLDIVNEFLESNLTEEEQNLFNIFLSNIEVKTIKNFKISFISSKHDKYIKDLNRLVYKMFEIKETDALFLVAKMEDKVHIIGRSNKEEIDISKILKVFSGGGHKGAGSATIKTEDIDNIKSKLIESVENLIDIKLQAKDIMSFPVKTLYDDMKISEANKIMLRYGHTGMPVVKSEKVIGIISRTDIDKAMSYNLSHAPVKGFMKSNIITVKPETTIDEINKIFSQNNIGRVPVISSDKVIGIVTRTDLLNQYYGDNYNNWYESNYLKSNENINFRQELKSIDKYVYSIVESIVDTANSKNMTIYLVGGFVRDVFLKKDNKDLDFVVEGDALELVDLLKSKYNFDIIIHEKFRTIKIINPNKAIEIDIVSARREYYEYPAALPTVEKSNIWNDLFRRDFTINCMAVQLNGEKPFTLLDYFSGIKDLNNKKIRVLYNLSFVEDPTRIFRAIKFASRFNFDIEDETYRFIKGALKDDMLSKLSNDRIRYEIISIIKDKNVCKSIELMLKLNIFYFINPNLKVDGEIIEDIYRLDKSLSDFINISKLDINYVELIIISLIKKVEVEDLDDIISLLAYKKELSVNIKNIISMQKHVINELKKPDIDNYILYNTLKDISDEGILYYYNNCNDNNVRHHIRYYKLKLNKFSINIDGNYLSELKIPKGPIYKEIIEHIKKLKINGYIYTLEDELKEAKRFFDEKLKKGELYDKRL